MSKQLNREEAWALLTEYNQDPFHLHHARTVEGVMRYFAQELGYGDEDPRHSQPRLRHHGGHPAGARDGKGALCDR